MLPVTDTASFYRMVQQNNLGSRAEQWGSMASRNQYRLAYEKTSHYLRPDLIAWIGAAVTVTFLTFSIQNALKIEAFSFQDPPDFLGRVNTKVFSWHTSHV